MNFKDIKKEYDEYIDNRYAYFKKCEKDNVFIKWRTGDNNFFLKRHKESLEFNINNLQEAEDFRKKHESENRWSQEITIEYDVQGWADGDGIEVEDVEHYVNVEWLSIGSNNLKDLGGASNKGLFRRWITNKVFNGNRLTNIDCTLIGLLVNDTLTYEQFAEAAKKNC